MSKTRDYLIWDETLSSVTHGIGALLSAVGLVMLIFRSEDEASSLRMVTFTVYGSILVAFYVMSALFHGLYFTRAKKLFQIFDHSSIYLLIAGTYAPYCLVTIKGWLGWSILLIICLMAVLGIVYKAIWFGYLKTVSTVAYVIMGWFCLVGGKALWSGLGKRGFELLFWGGVVFTVGAVIYSLKWLPFGHVIWHLFVMVGTALMYCSIYFYV